MNCLGIDQNTETAKIIHNHSSEQYMDISIPFPALNWSYDDTSCTLGWLKEAEYPCDMSPAITSKPVMMAIWEG